MKGMDMSHRQRVLVALVLLVSLVVPSATVMAKNAKPDVAPPGSSPYGRSYTEWSGAWHSWAFAQSFSVNPLRDDTGANCAQGQRGSVWFLGARSSLFGGDPALPVTRACTIPAGKALLFPIVNAFADFNGETVPPGSED